METIKTDGLELRVIRSKRRTVCLRIAADGQAEILAPRSAPRGELEHIAHEYAHKLRVMKERKAHQLEARSGFALGYGDKLRFLGAEREICASDVRYGYDADCFYIPEALEADGVRKAVVEIYKSAAREYIVRRTEELAAELGFDAPTVKINSAKTHWGSCSKQRRALNFSWLCMMADKDAVDYVIVHELCHLREFNHSPRFWKQVEDCCKDYMRQRAQLKKLASELENELWQI